MKKPAKKTVIEIADYSMQQEYSRTKLPTGAYSGIQPKDLTGIGETKAVKYPLGGGHAGRVTLPVDKPFERDGGAAHAMGAGERPGSVFGGVPVRRGSGDSAVVRKM